MEFKKLVALLVAIAVISPAVAVELSRKMSHEAYSLDNTLNLINMSETALIENIYSEQEPKDSFHDGYLLTKFVGYNGHPFYSNIWQLHRIQLTFTSLDPKKPPIIQNLGVTPSCTQQIAGTIQIDYTKNTVRNITIGFDQTRINYLQIRTEAGKQSLGIASQNSSTKLLNINGILLGVQAKILVYGVGAISFKYKVYSSATTITSLPTLLTDSAYANPKGGNPYDIEYPGFYITKIVGYNDRESMFDAKHLYKLELTLTSIDGTKPFQISTLGEGYSPISKQQLAGTINIDYSKTLVKRIIVGYDQQTLITIEVITTDGVSQKLNSQAWLDWRSTRKTFDINGYLVGVAGRQWKGIDALRFKYKVPV